METTFTATLLGEIEGFLAATGMAPSRFGLEAMGDGALVPQLRSGKRSLTIKNADKVLAYIRKSLSATCPEQRLAVPVLPHEFIPQPKADARQDRRNAAVGSARK